MAKDKYKFGSTTYGQNIAGKIAYWEKIGICKGIIHMLKDKLRIGGMDINDWKYEYNNGYKEYRVTFIIPTPEDHCKVLNYPMFEYNGTPWYIDMIHFDDELQVHLMGNIRKCRGEYQWLNGGWHTVREGLSLNDTMALYEYIDNRFLELTVLSKDDSDMFNETGALIKEGV